LAAVVEKLPIGTNLALYQFLWMLVSGALHNSRGAMFPALKSIGLSDEEVRRAWAAMRYGAWQTETLLETWQTHVAGQGEWQASQYAGYYTKAVDITAYWRPTLKGLKSKHYDAEADKALPAVVFGMVGRVGRVGQQRMALLTDLIRADLTDSSKTALQSKLLKQVAQNLGEDEMPVLDAGFKLKAHSQAGLDRFVLRLAKNFTAQRNFLPEYEGGRPSEYGEVVRPLARSYDGKQIAATAPDRIETWHHHGLEFRAEFWEDLVLTDRKPSAENPQPSPWWQSMTLVSKTPGYWLAHSNWAALTSGVSITTAGPLSSCLWLPNTWLALCVNLSPLKRAATVCLNYPCWLDPFRPFWPQPCPPFPSASPEGHRDRCGTATPKVPLAAYAVGWAGRLSQTCHLFRMVEFVKSRRLQIIYPRVFTLTDAQNSLR
jgi:hypothetical protein